jgi:hypothetical protein
VQKLLRLGMPAGELPENLGVNRVRWEEITCACSQKVVGFAEALLEQI